MSGGEGCDFGCDVFTVSIFCDLVNDTGADNDAVGEFANHLGLFRSVDAEADTDRCVCVLLDLLDGFTDCCGWSCLRACHASTGECVDEALDCFASRDALVWGSWRDERMCLRPRARLAQHFALLHLVEGREGVRRQHLLRLHQYETCRSRRSG